MAVNKGETVKLRVDVSSISSKARRIYEIKGSVAARE